MVVHRLIVPVRPTGGPALNADPFDQRRLLDVADLDARLGQLRHQLSTLPELRELAELGATRQAAEDRRRDAAILVEDLTAEQTKADADVEQVKTRRQRDRQRVDGGLVTNPKDLERMQHELVSLERRIAELEDIEIEVMERMEEAQGSLDDLIGQVAAADERLATLGAARDRRTEEIRAEVHATAADRDSLVTTIPADLLGLYERIRAQRGIGAALLRARQCGGCQLSLDAAELAEVRSAPAERVVRHEECGRILVRTDESGL